MRTRDVRKTFSSGKGSIVRSKVYCDSSDPDVKTIILNTPLTPHRHQKLCAAALAKGVNLRAMINLLIDNIDIDKSSDE